MTDEEFAKFLGNLAEAEKPRSTTPTCSWTGALASRRVERMHSAPPSQPSLL